MANLYEPSPCDISLSSRDTSYSSTRMPSHPVIFALPTICVTFVRRTLKLELAGEPPCPFHFRIQHVAVNGRYHYVGFHASVDAQADSLHVRGEPPVFELIPYKHYVFFCKVPDLYGLDPIRYYMVQTMTCCFLGPPQTQMYE